MKRLLTFWILALLASVSEAFAALAGTASSFQSSRQFACDDAKHKASIDADFNRNTETFRKKVKSVNIASTIVDVMAVATALRAALIGPLVLPTKSEE